MIALGYGFMGGGIWPPPIPPANSRGLHAPLKNPSQGSTYLHARWKQAWAESDEAIAKAKAGGMNVLANACILLTHRTWES